MSSLRATSCCGMSELDGVMGYENPKDCLTPILPTVISQRRSFIIFSCPLPHKHGDNLMDFIRDNKLGTVARSSIQQNPNSGNKLRVYVWTVDKKTVKKWHEDNKPFQFKQGDRVKYEYKGFGQDVPLLQGKEFTVANVVSSSYTEQNSITVVSDVNFITRTGAQPRRSVSLIIGNLTYIKPKTS